MEYSVSKIRRLARQFDKCSSSVEQVMKDEVRKVMSDLPDGMEGNAADALENRLMDLRSDLSSISGSLDDIASDLRAFARRLEIADQKAKENIQA